MELGRCCNCNDIIMNLAKKKKERFLPSYKEHTIEIDEKHLMRVAVCDVCKTKLVAGDKVQETADNILENHKQHWRNAKKGVPEGFEDFSVTDPNTNHQKYFKKKLSNQLSE